MLGEPPARLSFSPPLPETERGGAADGGREGGVNGLEKGKREDWKRKESRVDRQGETVKVRRGVLPGHEGRAKVVNLKKKVIPKVNKRTETKQLQ